MGMAGTAGSSGRELWRCVGCDAPASCTTPCVPLPRGQGGQKGVRRPSEEIPSLWKSSDSGSSLPKLCLLTELNLQFHGLVTMGLVYKIHELLGRVEERGEKHAWE